MSRKKYLLMAIGITLVFTVGVFLLSQGIVNAEECRIVRLYGGTGDQTKMRIEPKTTWVTPGTCVIWANWSRAPEAKVIFEEGKVCEDGTEAPSGFKIDAKNCYVTNFITRGATSSLTFKVLGKFKYRVEGTGGTPEWGQIIVRKATEG